MRQRKPFAVWLCCSAWMLGAVASVAAQFRAPPPTPVAKMPPLLYLRLAGPPGMKLSIQRGAEPAVSLDTPCVIGIRPGYCCRLALSNVRGFPGTTFYPSLDVHGSLWLISQLRNADFPATLL